MFKCKIIATHINTKRKWNTPELAIKSMHYYAKKRFPEFYKAYVEGDYKKAENILFYKLSNSKKTPANMFQEIFSGNPCNNNICPVFNGYYDALTKSFPELNLIKEFYDGGNLGKNLL